ALGYVGTFVATTATADRANLADPKDKVRLFNLMTNARELSKGDDRFERVIGMLAQVTKEDPHVIDAWFMLGNEHVKANRPAEAIEFFKKALALKPDYELAVVNMANAYRRLGREDVRLAHFNLALIAESRGELDGARREYLKEIELHERSFKAWFNLGRLYEKMGDRPRQIDALRESIDANPAFAEGYFYLAKAYFDGNVELPHALETARKGLSLAPHSPYAPLGHYVVADIYNRLGRPELAVNEVEQGRKLEKRR